MSNQSSPIIDSTSSPIVLGVIPKGFNPRQILVNMINEISPRKYESNCINITFVKRRKPTRSTNTRLKFVILPNQGLFSEVVVDYNRTHTEDLGVVSIKKGTSITTRHAISKINEYLGTFLNIEDIVDEPLPNGSAQTTVEFYLKFEDSCLQFYSGEKLHEIAKPTSFDQVDKAWVGLPLADNTPDILKPLSIPARLELDSAIAIEEAKILKIVDTLIVNAGGFSSTPSTSEIVYDGGNF